MMMSAAMVGGGLGAAAFFGGVFASLDKNTSFSGEKKPGLYTNVNGKLTHEDGTSSGPRVDPKLWHTAALGTAAAVAVTGGVAHLAGAGWGSKLGTSGLAGAGAYLGGMAGV